MFDISTDLTWILSAAVNVFLNFTLNKFKSTLKHSCIFFTGVYED